MRLRELLEVLVLAVACAALARALRPLSLGPLLVRTSPVRETLFVVFLVALVLFGARALRLLVRGR